SVVTGADSSSTIRSGGASKRSVASQFAISSGKPPGAEPAPAAPPVPSPPEVHAVVRPTSPASAPRARRRVRAGASRGAGGCGMRFLAGTGCGVAGRADGGVGVERVAGEEGRRTGADGGEQGRAGRWPDRAGAQPRRAWRRRTSRSRKGAPIAAVITP